MRTRTILSWLIAAALVVWAAAWTPKLTAHPASGSLAAQSQAQQPSPTQQPNQARQAPADQQQQQTFMGQIAKANGKFVLKNADTKATYELDDQGKAKQFEGQNVKVTGTLDAQSNTIHVSDIQPG